MCSNVGWCSVNAGVKLAFQRRRTTVGWRHFASLGQRSMHDLGFICPDIMAAIYLNRAVLRPSAVGNDAGSRRYRGLASMYYFINHACSGRAARALGGEASAFFCDLGHRIAVVTSEPGHTSFCCSGWELLRSVAVQLTFSELLQWQWKRIIFLTGSLVLDWFTWTRFVI